MHTRIDIDRKRRIERDALILVTRLVDARLWLEDIFSFDNILMGHLISFFLFFPCCVSSSRIVETIFFRLWEKQNVLHMCMEINREDSTSFKMKNIENSLDMIIKLGSIDFSLPLSIKKIFTHKIHCLFKVTSMEDGCISEYHEQSIDLFAYEKNDTWWLGTIE